MEKAIDLSVLIPTYNHERYIRRTLDGVLSQKTKYTYEVLVGEDASPDGTRAVLRRYEAEHPGRLTVFYRAENLGRSGAQYDNLIDLYRRAKGKYVIVLEGDDYWIDDGKIEKQVGFLEAHEDYIAVAHGCVVVDEHGAPREELYPECHDAEYTMGHYLRNILPGQLATVMMRNIYAARYFDTSILERWLVPGDRLLYFALLTGGKICCMREKMTAYRYVTSGGTSYSANVRYDFSYDERWHRALLGFARGTRRADVARAAETLYIACLMRGVKHRALPVGRVSGYLGDMRHLPRAAVRFFGIYVPILCKKGFRRMTGGKNRRI